MAKHPVFVKHPLGAAFGVLIGWCIHSKALVTDAKVAVNGRFLSKTLIIPWTWCRTYLVPAAYKRRREAKKLADVYEIYNAEFSLLHRLPPELILEISDHLPAADNLASYLACRRHAVVLRSTVHRLTSNEDKKELHTRLRRDRYRQEAEVEPPDISGLTQLLCSFCQTSHHRSLFAAEDLQTSPYSRKCFGSQAVFRACKHQSCTFAELKEMIEGEGHSFCPTWPASYRKCIQPFLGRLDNPPRVYYHNYLLWRDIAGSEVISRSTVQNYLRTLAEPICPHMRTNGVAFQRRIAKTPGQNIYTRKTIPATDVFAEAFTHVRLDIACSAPFCDTKVYIQRWPDICKGILTVEVHRELGPLHSVTDPKWCAQLEAQNVW